MTEKQFDAELYNLRHTRNIVKRMEIIKRLYMELADRAAAIGATLHLNANGEFFFSNFPSASSQVDDMLRDLSKEVTKIIKDGDIAEWKLSNLKNDVMIGALAASVAKKVDISKDMMNGWKIHNLDALAEFKKRKIEGMSLSQKVWNLTKDTKMELELAIELGLGEGKSADEMSRSIRKYLKEPNRLFRRVRDEKGNLRLSKAAQAYHPGQGVYRSSYKNALRLTATENNIAYRSSDYTRWQQMPFVLGIRINLSNNHTLNGKPFYDICDELAGLYPKNFKFTGWHPNCRCYATTELARRDQFIDYARRMATGQDVSNYRFSGEVTKMPKVFDDWKVRNAERIERAEKRGKLPYFLKDNKGIV